MAKIISYLVFLLIIAACTPTVKLEPPEKPITINLNVKVEHEIRVEIDRDLDQLISNEDDLF